MISARASAMSASVVGDPLLVAGGVKLPADVIKMSKHAIEWREREALTHCSVGFVEEPASFPRGVGRKTLETLAEKGWIENKTCSPYGTFGYQITEAGKAALYGE